VPVCLSVCASSTYLVAAAADKGIIQSSRRKRLDSQSCSFDITVFCVSSIAPRPDKVFDMELLKPVDLWNYTKLFCNKLVVTAAFLHEGSCGPNGGFSTNVVIGTGPWNLQWASWRLPWNNGHQVVIISHTKVFISEYWHTYIVVRINKKNSKNGCQLLLGQSLFLEKKVWRTRDLEWIFLF